MAPINTHGLNIDIDRLLAVAAATSDTGPDVYYIIGYDLDDGDVRFWEGTNNNWVEFGGNVVVVARDRHRHTAQWIADMIADTLADLNN